MAYSKETAVKRRIKTIETVIHGLYRSRNALFQKRNDPKSGMQYDMGFIQYRIQKIDENLLKAKGDLIILKSYLSNKNGT